MAVAQLLQCHAGVVGGFLITGLFEFLERPDQILDSSTISVGILAHIR